MIGFSLIVPGHIHFVDGQALLIRFIMNQAMNFIFGYWFIGISMFHCKFVA